MLTQLIESKSNASENARKNRFLLGVLGLMATTMLGSWTVSLYGKSFGLGAGDLEMSSLVAPVTVADQTPPVKIEQRERSKSINRVILEELYEDLDRSAVPDDSLGRKNVITARQYGLGNVTRGLRNQIPEGAGRSGPVDDPSCGFCDEPRDTRTKTPDGDFPDVVKPKPNPTPAATPKRPVSLGPVNGIATFLPKPTYSPAAILVRASGPVHVQVTIDETGNVISAAAVSGHPLLKSAAVEAARRSKFTPTLLSKVPVKVTGIIIYNFLPR